MCACETWRKLTGPLAVLAIVVALCLGASARPAAADPAPPDAVGTVAQAQPPTPAVETAGEHNAEEAAKEGKTEAHEENSIWGLVGKIVNFAVLAGALFYFFRSPAGQYLANRNAQIRNDLVTATRVKEEATAQIADIQQKLERLPTEIDALRDRGRQEIAAEEARITRDAEAERERLLDQTRREIDLQLRVARRDLLDHAADLSVQIARERIAQRITDDDQRRLVERYLEQVKQA